MCGQMKIKFQKEIIQKIFFFLAFLFHSYSILTRDRELPLPYQQTKLDSRVLPHEDRGQDISRELPAKYKEYW